ncbi:MAG: hypothetical protein OK454_08850, partial [Thaumarchaeota archaeon]|nr:hypothetical protein [Nitrososphaerota archaeon]
MMPTPVPSPAPEKQQARSSTPPTESEGSSRDGSEKPKSGTDVVTDPKGDVVETPTKSVTWGENETKRYMDYSSDHSQDVPQNGDVEPAEEKPKPRSNKTSNPWGMIAAAIAGGAGAAAAVESLELKKERPAAEDEDSGSKSSSRNRNPIEPVMASAALVDELEDLPPAPGRKPASPPSSQIPGQYADDLDFTAHVAAGLDRAGFDPKIVIDDDNFRRRDSPPGSNDEPGLYQRPFAETVSDLGFYDAASSENGKALSEPGYVVDGDIPSALSKRERKRLEKEAKRKSLEARDLEPLPEHVSTTLEPVVSAEETFDTPTVSKKEQKKRDKALRASQLAQEEEESFSPKEHLFESAAKEGVWADAPSEQQPIEAADAGDDERAESSFSTTKKKKQKKSK